MSFNGAPLTPSCRKSKLHNINKLDYTRCLIKRFEKWYHHVV